MPKKKLNFEESMERLDGIVKLLEKGDAPLDELLGLFEEGTALIRACEKMLSEAEQKVARLRKGADGAPEELPFQPEE